jgi:hypothetical protein
MQWLLRKIFLRGMVLLRKLFLKLFIPLIYELRKNKKLTICELRFLYALFHNLLISIFRIHPISLHSKWYENSRLDTIVLNSHRL